MRELNWKPGQTAELTVLGNANGDTLAKLPARILDSSGKRMRIACDSSLPGGAPVRLEWDEQLVLGEVLHPEPGGFWLEVHHMLLDATGLTWQKAGWQPG